MSRHSSPLENEPCKQCTSFSDYIKSAKKKVKEESKGGIATVSDGLLRDDCPLDKDELGRGTWGLLHTMAAKFPKKPTELEQKDMKNFFSTFSKFYPCDHCAEEFREEIKEDPPKTTSQEALSMWLCGIHNKINSKTGKPQFDCSKVFERWRDGWADGSCDY